MAKPLQNPVFYTQYNPMPCGSLEFDYEKYPSLTQQHYKDECDINSIIDKYGIVAVQESIIARREKLENEVFYDYSDFDYDKEQQRIAELKSDFYALPSSVRAEFDNNVSKWHADCIKKHQLKLDAQNSELDVLYKEQMEKDNISSTSESEK